MKYTAQVEKAVGNLDSAGKLFFNILIDESQKNPFEVIKKINDGVSNGEIEPEYHIAAALARTAIKAALDPSAEKPDFNDRTAAVSLIREKISEAEEQGDTEQAERYRAAMKKTAAGEETARVKAEAGRKELDRLKTSQQAEKVERYNESYFLAKDSAIQLLRNSRMDAREAESYFAEHQEKALTETLMRGHAVTAADIADS